MVSNQKKKVFVRLSVILSILVLFIHAFWNGSVVVPMPFKILTYSALRFITGAIAFS